MTISSNRSIIGITKLIGGDFMKNLKFISNYFLVSGIVFTLLGILGLFNPTFFSIYLVELLAIFFMIGGVKNLTKSLQLKKEGYQSGGFIFFAVIEILFALSLMITPFSSQIYLIVYVGIFVFIKGVLILLNILFKLHMFDDFYSSTLGHSLIDIVFGIVLVTLPLFSQQFIILCLAWYLLFAGINFIVSSFYLNNTK